MRDGKKRWIIEFFVPIDGCNTLDLTKTPYDVKTRESFSTDLSSFQSSSIFLNAMSVSWLHLLESSQLVYNLMLTRRSQDKCLSRFHVFRSLEWSLGALNQIFVHNFNSKLIIFKGEGCNFSNLKVMSFKEPSVWRVSLKLSMLVLEIFLQLFEKWEKLYWVEKGYLPKWRFILFKAVIVFSVPLRVCSPSSVIPLHLFKSQQSLRRIFLYSEKQIRIFSREICLFKPSLRDCKATSAINGQLVE